MPLLFCDLDNTLIDRAGAYKRWAARFLDDRGDDPHLLDRMIAADGDGLRPRPEVAAALGDLLGLSQGERQRIVSVLRAGVVDELVTDHEVISALRRIRAHGWDVVIVTNGSAEAQERKIAMLGLDDEVDGWVVSEAVGAAKPDAAIFLAAAEEVSVDDLSDAWMIGDCAATDIAGAANLGISSVWLHRGRLYPDQQPEPTARAASFPEAVEHILSV